MKPAKEWFEIWNGLTLSGESDVINFIERIQADAEAAKRAGLVAAPKVSNSKGLESEEGLGFEPRSSRLARELSTPKKED